MEAEATCGGVDRPHDRTALRIGAIFVILVTSLIGAIFPIVARRVDSLHVPAIVFDAAKFFGSGVIIATGFIHLLAPALEELESECLTGTWTVYPWALALAMASVFGIFLVELFAHRIGTEYLDKMNSTDENQHLHAHQRDEESDAPVSDVKDKSSPTDEKHHLDLASEQISKSEASAQILGVAILEFGVVFHSVIIGLTLAVTDDFTILFIVIIFHQFFEAIGLGSRLAFLPLPKSMNWIPIAGGVLYTIMTPIGMAIGLGVRSSYNPEGTTASIVTGVLDALSAGILLYTGMVELLARDFIFHKQMHSAPWPKLLFNLGCVLLGAGLMALLGRWA